MSVLTYVLPMFKNTVRAFGFSATLCADSIQDIVILGSARTPIGSFRSSLASVPSSQLASVAITAALHNSNVDPSDIQEAYIGSVCQANLGQAPARQAVLAAGLPTSTPCTTVNKVCASGLKAIMMACQSLKCGDQQLMLAGGMESMSRVPYYMPRGDTPYGSIELIDGIVKDGLTDAYDHIHMGTCAEKTARDYGISRQDQDNYAIQSYQRSADAWQKGIFKAEVVPVTVTSRKGETVVDTDEEFTKVDFDKIDKLKAVFAKENGTITAGNASSLNDGAAAVVLAREERACQMGLGLQNGAKVLAYADAAVNPVDFSIAPAKAILIALKKANLRVKDIDLWEINEAFSVVVLAVSKELNLDLKRVNVHGGAVSLGHPIGMSGARLITHLVHVLESGQKGMAAICNGGGGAAAMILQKL